MKDLKNATIEEMDAMSIIPSLDEEENVVLDPDNYWEEYGIRFYKKPLKINFGYWACSTIGCKSLAVDKHNKGIIYVFANALFENDNSKLIDFFESNHLSELGYCLHPGLSKMEVNAID